MKKRTVLIVEDEMDMRIFLATLMETSGYQPVITRDGREGMRKARDVCPDLVILDVMMPGEGGVLMYRQLRTHESLCQVPVIMLSAVAEKTFAHYLNMVNARLLNPIPDPDAYIEKPPDAAEILKVAAELLE